MNQTIDILMNHTSIRKYHTNKAVSNEMITTIIDCAQMAPTSSHFQAYTIIQVNNKEKRNILVNASGGQEYLNEAPVVLLFCADLHRANKYYENIDPTILSNTESYTVAVIDASLAAQKALIAAQSMGLGGVVIGGIRNDIELISKTFELPNLVFPMFALCIGYAADKPDIKPRLPIKAVLKQDFYDESEDYELINSYNKTISNYYDNRTNGKSKDRWTERCGKYLISKPREHVGEFLRKIGFIHH